MVHIFHFLPTSLIFEIVNPFSWIFNAISSEQIAWFQCLSWLANFTSGHFRTLEFFPPTESWLVNSNFPRASHMQSSLYAKRYMKRKLHEFVILPKLESSRNLTSKVISDRVKGRKSKSTEQYDCKLFFRLDGRCNSMVKLSNSTGWHFDSTIKFNTSTGEEHCEWFVCGTEVAFDI